MQRQIFPLPKLNFVIIIISYSFLQYLFWNIESSKFV